METENSKKQNENAQISFKTSKENRLKLEEEAQKLGLNLSEYVKLVLNGSQGNEVKRKAEVIKVDSKTENQENLTTNDLLRKLIDVVSGKPDSEEEMLSREEEISEALNKQEADLRSQNLMLKLTEKQRNVFFNLMMFKKENGGKYCDSPESFFFSILKEKFYDDWFTSVPAGFKKEFNEAFADYLDAKQKPVMEKKEEAKQKEDLW